MTDSEIRLLIYPRHFAEAWFRILPQHKTYEDAYEALEIVYIEYFKRRKYSDYQSFRQVKNRIFKAK
jgi:hypothetical protein